MALSDEAQRVLAALEHPDVHLNRDQWHHFAETLRAWIHRVEGEPPPPHQEVTEHASESTESHSA